MRRIIALLVALLLLCAMTLTGCQKSKEEETVKTDGIIDAAVFILLGQSNAVGHSLPMTAEDEINTPMANVYGLHCAQNQKLDLQELKWSGYTSKGMNLGETQDHTYSLANCLALNWQAHIDAGNEKNLPDLYIINISIGAEGVTGNYMWNPDRTPTLTPGKLGTVNISLYPFSQQVFSLVDESFKSKGMDYEYVGLHWRGGENDLESVAKGVVSTDKLTGIYTTLIEMFNDTLGNPPIVLHEIVAKDRMNEGDPTGAKLWAMETTNTIYQDFNKTYSNVTTFDVRNYPDYDPNVRGEGMFKDDMIHFTADVNKWVAQQIFEGYIASK